MVSDSLGDGVGVEAFIDSLVKINFGVLGEVVQGIGVENNGKGNEILDNDLVGKDVFFHGSVEGAELKGGMLGDEWRYEIYVPSLDTYFYSVERGSFKTNLKDLVQPQRDRLNEEWRALSAQIKNIQEELEELDC